MSKTDFSFKLWYPMIHRYFPFFDNSRIKNYRFFEKKTVLIRPSYRRPERFFRPFDRTGAENRGTMVLNGSSKTVILKIIGCDESADRKVLNQSEWLPVGSDPRRADKKYANHQKLESLPKIWVPEPGSPGPGRTDGINGINGAINKDYFHFKPLRTRWSTATLSRSKITIYFSYNIIIF